MQPNQPHSNAPVNNDALQVVHNELIVEEPLEIYLDNRRFAALMRTPAETPAEDLLLTQGLLFSEGVISGLEELERLELSASIHEGMGRLSIVNALLHNSLTLPAGIWERPLFSNSASMPLEKAAPDLNLIRTLPEKMRPNQGLLHRTGAGHAAAIFDTQGELLCCYEDIASKSAVDKALGFGLENYLIPAMEPLTLLVSGHIDLEIIQRTLMARIATVCSFSVASNLAVEVATKNNINVVGRLGMGGLVVY